MEKTMTTGEATVLMHMVRQAVLMARIVPLEDATRLANLHECEQEQGDILRAFCAFRSAIEDKTL